MKEERERRGRRDSQTKKDTGRYTDNQRETETDSYEQVEIPSVRKLILNNFLLLINKGHDEVHFKLAHHGAYSVLALTPNTQSMRIG